MTLEATVLERPKDATVEAKLLFLEPAAEKPRLSFGYDTPASDISAIYTPRTVTLRDARKLWPVLDIEGFQLVQHRSAVRDFWDEDQAGGLGHAEAAQIVADATGATRVHVFDHTQRRRAPDAPRQPSTRVHVDYTAGSAPQRVRELLGDDAERLLRKPYAFVNVWRPVRHAALDWPLALADARSVAPGDLVATDIVYPDRRGEIYGATYSPHHRWYYVPDLQLDEALLIKCFDSRAGVASFTPHTAFENPRTPANAPPRESIEFRTIAFFD